MTRNNEDTGGAAVERKTEPSREHAAGRAAIDATYEASARGEHRYPDVHQTPAERKARDDRDLLKRKWRGGQ
jgi:hypothetical protein